MINDKPSLDADNSEEQEPTQKKKLSKKQKVAIAGAAIVAAYATYKLVDSGAYRELINAGKKFVQNSNNSSPFKKDNRLASKDFDAGAIHTMVVNGINPNYGAVGTIKSCVLYKNLYIFCVINDDDPIEGDLDPFYSVNVSTGECRDFSIITDIDMDVYFDLLERKNLVKGR